MSWSGSTCELDPRVRDAYEEVPLLERKASGWLILRGLTRNPTRARELERYGPRGAVGLARMRAMQGWGYIVFVPVVALSFVLPDALWLVILIGIPFLGVVIFGVRAASEGRRWRSEHGID